MQKNNNTAGTIANIRSIISGDFINRINHDVLELTNLISNNRAGVVTEVDLEQVMKKLQDTHELLSELLQKLHAISSNCTSYDTDDSIMIPEINAAIEKWVNTNLHIIVKKAVLQQIDNLKN